MNSCSGPCISVANVSLHPLGDIDEVGPGCDLGAVIAAALRATGLEPQPDDVLVVAQKIVSKAEDRFRQLKDVVVSDSAMELADITDKDPRVVELVLTESTEVVRAAKDVLIVRHRLGFVMAQAGVDHSNLPDDQTVLLLPQDPDASAAALRARLAREFGHAQGPVIVSDSFGRPWRMGTTNVAIGAAGVATLWDRRGEADRHGRKLEITQVAWADAIAGAAGLLHGRGCEGIPAVLVCGLPRVAARTPGSGSRASHGAGSLPVSNTQVIALTGGGVGGAKLCLGLARCVEGDRLTCIVNTADDFEHLGLRISPDLDTLLYTLAGCANPELGWGRQDETWTFMAVLEQLGGPTWFRLGDGDLAIHIERTRRLASGESLTEVTARLASRFGVESRLLPMTDDTVATRVHTDQGPLDFRTISSVTGRRRSSGNSSIRELRPPTRRRPSRRHSRRNSSGPFSSVRPILSSASIRSYRSAGCVSSLHRGACPWLQCRP